MKRLFLDTNVIIGFIFLLDSLNPYSNHIFRENNNIYYYSFHVAKEIEEVFNRKNSEYTSFFVFLINKLDKCGEFDFISESSLHEYIDKSNNPPSLSKDNLHHALNKIWELLDLSENQEVGELKLKLRRLNIYLQNKYVVQKNNFIKNAMYIPAHEKKDNNVMEMIKNKSLSDKLHGADSNILFDIHEYVKFHSDLDLIFVSWDCDFIRVIKELLSVLSFNEYICLKDTN